MRQEMEKTENAGRGAGTGYSAEEIRMGIGLTTGGARRSVAKVGGIECARELEKSALSG